MPPNPEVAPVRVERWFRRAALGAVLCAGVLSAVAYDFIRTGGGRIIKWDPGTVTMLIRVPESGPLTDGNTYRSSILSAMEAWNIMLGRVQFAGITQAPGSGGNGNGSNEIFFSSTIYGSSFGSSTLAVATTFTQGTRPDNTARRVEGDIIFNTARTWDSYSGQRNSQPYDIRRVAIHELGHILGLDHPDQAAPVQSVIAIMNSTVSSIDMLQLDDVAGGQALYGGPTDVLRPVNNLFADATPITLTAPTARLEGNNTHAHKQHQEPFHAPTEPGGTSVWWRWTAPVSGSLKVTTRDSNFDTMLAAYTGNTVESLTQLAANDDEQAPGSVPEATRIRTSIITIGVTAGETYHFAVDGWDGETGNIFLNLELTSPPIITSSPAGQNVFVGQSVTFHVAAFGDGALSYQWRRFGELIPGATGPSLHLPAVTLLDAGSYDVVVSNAQGGTASGNAVLEVSKFSQQVSFGALPDVTYTTTPITLSASASSGLPVQFLLVGGPAQINGSTLTLLASGTVSVAAYQSGDDTFLPAPDVVRTFSVAKAAAGLSLGNLSATYDGTAHAATATTTPADLPVSFTYDGAASPPVGAGSYAVSAAIDDLRYAGTAGGTLVIAPAAQSIAFAPLADRTLPAAPFALSASATSGLPVQFTLVSGPAQLAGSLLTLTGPGTVVVEAAQPGDANHLAAAPVQRSFTVTSALGAWNEEYFSAAELADPDISGPNADPDGDGLNNLLEYALGLDPRAGDSAAALPAAGLEDGEWHYTFTRPTDRADLIYAVEVSTDLQTWTGEGVTLDLVTAQDGLETWRARVAGGAEQLFFRLKITRP